MSKGFFYSSALSLALGLLHAASASAALPDPVVTDLTVNAECRPDIAHGHADATAVAQDTDEGATDRTRPPVMIRR